MRLEEALLSYLISNQSIKDRINDKIYPYILPQKCLLPAVVYSLVSIERMPAFQKDINFVKQTMQFSCMAKKYSEAIEVMELIRSTLQDFSGNMYDVWVGAVHIVTENISYEPNTDTYISQIELEFQLT